MDKKWFAHGIPTEEEREERQSKSFIWWQRDLPGRFWMRSGEAKVISFVDDTCFRIWEHQFWMDGNPGFATCIKSIAGKCPLCDAGNKAYEVGFFTVIDHTGYRDKEGVEHKDYLSLLPAKHFTMDVLDIQHTKRKGLIGKKFEATRSNGNKAPTVGDIWDYEGEVDLPDDADPLDYESILEPFNVDDLKEIALLGEWRGKQGNDYSTGSSGNYSKESSLDYAKDEDAVPF